MNISACKTVRCQRLISLVSGLRVQQSSWVDGQTGRVQVRMNRPWAIKERKRVREVCDCIVVCRVQYERQMDRVKNPKQVHELTAAAQTHKLP